MAACFPIPEAEASREIQLLIQEKGIDSLTSKIIRKHLENKFNCENLSNHKAFIDSLTLEQINQLKNIVDKKEETYSDSDNSSVDLKTSSTDIKVPEEVKKEIKKAGVKRAGASVTTTTVKKAKSEQFVAPEADDDDMASSVKRRRQCVIQKKTTTSRKKKEKDPNAAPRSSAFSKLCVLSDELAAFFDGKRYMRRSDVVKGMWDYFKANNLNDPKDRRMIVLDDKLKSGFGMMKTLKNHIKDAEFLDAETKRQIEAELAAENEAKNPSTSKALPDPDESSNDEDQMDAQTVSSKLSKSPPEYSLENENETTTSSAAENGFQAAETNHNNNNKGEEDSDAESNANSTESNDSDDSN